jgi:hypothetical protein
VGALDVLQAAQPQHVVGGRDLLGARRQHLLASRAIHIYGGDFFAPPSPRSEWDPETLREREWNLDDTRRLFEEAEARSRT